MSVTRYPAHAAPARVPRRRPVWPVVLMAFSVGLAAFLLYYPVYRERQFHLPHAVVLDADQQPIPGVTLTFQDPESGRSVSRTTDDRGQFRLRGLGHLADTVAGGYGLVRMMHSTGGSDGYFFSPLGTQTVRVHDSQGRPVSGLLLQPLRNFHAFNVHQNRELDTVTTGPDGTAVLGRYPSSARVYMNTYGTGYAVISVTPTIHGNDVHYDVTVARTGAIEGRILYADGSPVDDDSAFAVPAGGAFSPWDTTERNGVPEVYFGRLGANGHYVIRGVPPGEYQVGWRSEHFGQSHPPPVYRTVVTVRSDKTSRAPDLVPAALAARPAQESGRRTVKP